MRRIGEIRNLDDRQEIVTSFDNNSEVTGVLSQKNPEGPRLVKDCNGSVIHDHQYRRSLLSN